VKRIRKSRTARFLSWLLTVATIMPMFAQMVVPTAAQAQAAAAGSVQTVIVLDFQNKSKVLGDALARLATDAVAVELANSARFEVLKRDEVIRQANELGLKPPFDPVAKTRLANALGATAFVDGAIEYVREERGTPKTINVGLTVRVGDAATGDLLSGAAQIGSSTARPGITDNEALIQDATNNAAVLAVRQILSYNLPEATVLSSVGSDNVLILINRGSRDGIEQGMEMIVHRDRQRVGRIRITQVFPTDAEARIVENILGIKPEDKVRAVFPMPTFDERSGVVRKVSRGGGGGAALSTVGKVLLVLLVGLVIATAAKGGSASVTGVVAEPTIRALQPAVRIKWKDNIFGSGQTIEYHVWRSPDVQFNPTGTPIAAVGGGQREYFDLPAPFSFWNGVNSFVQPGIVTDPNQQGQNLTTVTPAAGFRSGFPTVGTTFVYLITSVQRIPLVVTTAGGAGGGGGQTGFRFLETDPVASGPATPLNQPTLGTPADTAANVDITRQMTFTFNSQIGADEFQLEFSTDRTFTNPRLIKRIGPVFSTAPNASGVLQSVSVPAFINLAAGTGDPVLMQDPGFAAFVNRVPGAARPTLFWRVGARNSGDRPGPVHALTQRHDDGDRTFRFIYSPVRSFTPADVPPPPPGG